MKLISIAYIFMLSILLTACSTNSHKSTMTLKSYQFEPAIIVDKNDGINKQEAEAILIKIGDLYNIPEVKILNDLRLVKNYWVTETYTVNKSKPKQFWINSRTGSLERGYKKKISLNNISEKSSKIKELKKGVFQIIPPVSINQNDGINKNEAQHILQMYRLVSIGGATIYYTPVVSEGGYWVSKKIGHWGYKTMKYPIKINKKSGDLTHGLIHYKLSNLYSEYQKARKKYYRTSKN